MSALTDEAVAQVLLLAETYSVEDGKYLRHGPKWDNDRWKNVLTKSNLTNFAWDPRWGTKVTRGLVLDLWPKVMDENEAVNAFFLTMVWGLGDHYLGPFKMKKMLTSRPVADLGSLLLNVRSRVAVGPRGEDIEALKGTYVEVLKGAYVEVLSAKISHLGPVYATKLLYAMSPVTNRSPVMDIWVERWGSGFGLDFGLDSTKKWAWNADKLAKFTSFCDDCIMALTTQGGDKMMSEFSDRGFVEYLVFWDAKYRSRRPWINLTEFPMWVTRVGQL